MLTLSMASNSRNKVATAADLPCSARVNRPMPPVVPGPVAKRSSAGSRPLSMTTDSSNVSPSVRSCSGIMRAGSFSGGAGPPVAASAPAGSASTWTSTLEGAAAPAVADSNSRRELFVGPAFARSDESRKRGVVVDGPRFAREESRQLAPRAIDKRDRHAPE